MPDNDQGVSDDRVGATLPLEWWSKVECVRCGGGGTISSWNGGMGSDGIVPS